MAGKKKEPNIKDQAQETVNNQSYWDFLKDLRTQTGIDFQDSQSWRNKMIIATNQRLGIKRYSDFPYPGAPDIPLPETDKIIKKSLPNLVLSAWAPKNPVIVQVKQGTQERPEYKDKVRKANKAMNSIIRSKDLNWFKKLVLAADNRKHYGHCIFKVYEEFKSRWVHKTIDLSDYPPEVLEELKQLSVAELKTFVANRYDLDLEDDDEKLIVKNIVDQFKSGEEIIEFDVEHITSNPQVDVVLPTRLDVPSYTTDINKAVRIRETYFLPRHIIEQNMNNGIFTKKNKEELDGIPKFSATEEDLIENQKSRNEGVTDNTSQTDMYRLETICCWHKDKESEPAKRKVFTFFADVSDCERALLQEIDFPFEFEGWFYEKDDNEIKDPRYYNSRGVPEQIRAMQEVMERSINNMIIRDEMTNTPIWEVLKTSEIMDDHKSLTPGQKLGVDQLGTEIKQLNQFPNVDNSSYQIMTTLKAYTEEYLAVSDQLFRNATNAGGGKTLGEINVGVQQNQGALNLDIISWNESLSRVYQKIFSILAERLGDSLYIEGEEVTKEDFNFPADVKSNGNLEISNQQMAVVKAAQRLQALLNPSLQDIVNSEDRYNALKDWLEKDGVKDPDQFCTDPKEMAQQVIVQMQQQIKQMQQMIAQSEEAMKKQAGRTQSMKLQESELQGEAKKDIEIMKESVMLKANEEGQKMGRAFVNELQK